MLSPGSEAQYDKLDILEILALPSTLPKQLMFCPEIATNGMLGVLLMFALIVNEGQVELESLTVIV